MLAQCRRDPNRADNCGRAVVAGILLAMALAACGRSHPDREQDLAVEEAPAPAADIGGLSAEMPRASDAQAGQRLPRLLDLGSTNCIPCKLMAPILEELREEYRGRMEVTFVDVRRNPDAARQHRIQIIPTQIFFDASGVELERHVGFMSKDDILATWRKLGVDLG
jgi:thioredoxin 1